MSKNYCMEDLENFIRALSKMSCENDMCCTCENENAGSTESIEVKKIIIAGKKTIMLFDDGTKTISTCLGKDKYSLEAGISICLLKKVFGNNAVGKFFKGVEEACADENSDYVYTQKSSKKKRKANKKESELNE